MIIYKITNTINNKIYIGLTTRTLDIRIKQHFKDSIIKNHPLYRAIRKYGWCNFKYIIIDTAANQEELNKKEEYYIKEFNSLSPNGYNLQSGGANGIPNAEARLNMSLAHIGKILPEEQKTKIGLANKGKKRTIEARKKYSIAKKGHRPWNKGIPRSEETKKKIGIANSGKHPTEEAKAKMHLAHKGKKLSAEHSASISVALKGVPKSLEHNRKVSLAHKGVPWTEAQRLAGNNRSEEHRCKISESLKGNKCGAGNKGKYASKEIRFKQSLAKRLYFAFVTMFQRI